MRRRNLPGIYQGGEFDLAGFIVGVVEKEDVIDGHDIQVGDVLLAMPSSGLHTNGYSLVRSVFAEVPLSRHMPEFGRTLADELLTPHRSYLDAVLALRQKITVKGLAHITGGGLIENLPRILPQGRGAIIDVGSWVIPPIFRYLQAHVTPEEAFRVFNMGVGMVVVASAEDAPKTGLQTIGRIVAGEGVTIHHLPPHARLS